MDLQVTIRKRLDYFSRNVLFDPSRTEPPSKEHDALLDHDRRVLSSLPLQMSLFFNVWFFPLWWITETVMVHIKYPFLPNYYKFILVTILILMTLIEAIRLYLGYVGNLHEKVPELAGFWLMTTVLQFPLILFQQLNEAILILPLERGVHIVLTIFILTQALSGFVALRDMVRHTKSQFRLQQFNGNLQL